MKSRLVLPAFVLALFFVAPAANAGLFTFATELSGAVESPVNDSKGTGFVLITFDTTAHTMRVQLNFQGLTGTTTASHVHAATALPNTGTASVATELPSFTGFPLGVKAGSYDHTFNTSLSATWNPSFMTGSTAAQKEAGFLQALKDQKAYLNIHSSYKTGGEIRGFLHAAPEPSTVGLALMGVAGVVVARRRRVSAAV